MRKQKLLLVFSLIFLSVIIFTPCSYAQGMYRCQIDEIGGPWNGYDYITLTDISNDPPEFVWTAFRLDPDRVNRDMAVALTAMSLEKGVRVWLDQIVTSSTIQQMYLQR